MRKILYFCNCDLKIKNGHGLMIRAHYKMLNELYQNCIITFMVSDNIYGNKYICCLSPTRTEKFISVLMGYSPDLSLRAINQFLKIIKEQHIDTVFIESSMFGNLIRKIKNIDSRIRVIAYFTDIEADLLNQELVCSGFKRRMVIRRLMQNERLTIKYADKKFVLNKRDEKLYIDIYGRKPDAIIPVIISSPDLVTEEEIHPAGEKLKLLFVGGDFWPNIDGIRWFADDVLSKISVPCELEIVGVGMEKYRTELENKSSLIHVIGTVDDLKPYFMNSDLFIAPIRKGGGMKVKTAEALSYGKTFLGLEEALIGYWEFIPEAMKRDGIIRCIDAEDFAHTIDAFFDKTFYKCRGDIKAFIDSLCSYEVNLEKFKCLFEE